MQDGHGMRRFFLRKLWRRFSTVRGHRHYGFTGRSSLDTLRRWLDEIGISFFECDSCQALHLPHMQNFDGIFDAKIDLGGQRGALFRPWRR